MIATKQEELNAMQTIKLSPAGDYINLVNQVQAELDALQVKADNHFGTNPDTLNWGHVGDLDNILSLLQKANGKESQNET